MDLLKCLSDDHRELKTIFKRLALTTERGAKSREKLFGRLKNLLSAHATAEEDVLYDRLRDQKSSRELSLRALEEHHVARVLLQELDALDKGDERWGAKLQVLQESLEHHIEEEENTIFKAARKLMSRDELGDLGEEFEAQKADLLAGELAPVRAARKVVRNLRRAS